MLRILLLILAILGSTQVVSGGPIDDGLVLWLDANENVTSNGTGVSQWASRKGTNFAHAPAGSEPELTTSSLNGLPSVDFDLTGDFLELDTPVALDVANGGASVFLVYNSVGTEVGGAVLASASSNFLDFFIQRGNTPFPFQVGSLFASDSSFPFDTAGFRIVSIDFVSANEASVFSDGLLAISGDPGTSATAAIAQIGQRGDGPQFSGSIAEVLVYDRSLSPEELNETGFYLADKFGIATAYTNPVPEPNSLACIAAALLGVGCLRRR